MKEYALVDSKKVANGEYPYVYVCENGEVRELSEDEREYLETKFYPTDGARPYVKYRY